MNFSTLTIFGLSMAGVGLSMAGVGPLEPREEGSDPWYLSIRGTTRYHGQLGSNLSASEESFNKDV